MWPAQKLLMRYLTLRLLLFSVWEIGHGICSLNASPLALGEFQALKVHTWLVAPHWTASLGLDVVTPKSQLSKPV